MLGTRTYKPAISTRRAAGTCTGEATRAFSLSESRGRPIRPPAVAAWDERPVASQLTKGHSIGSRLDHRASEAAQRGESAVTTARGVEDDDDDDDDDSR